MKPLISVIVPIYNNAILLKKCINSIICQVYDNIELILVNDGSTDNCYNICEEYKKLNRNIKVIHHQNNMGVSHARNSGLKIAKGEYIGFVDSDDWIEPDMYEILYNNILRSHAQISIIGFLFQMSNGEKFKLCNDETYLILSSCEAIKKMFIGTLFAGQLCNKLFQAQLFKELVLNENIQIYEDMLLTWDLFFRSQTIVFHGVCKYNYIIKSNSAYNSEFDESYYSINMACEMMIEKTKIYFPEIINYAKASAISANITIIKKKFISSNIQKKYCRLAINNIRKNMTFGSLFKISGRINKLIALSLFININLYKACKLLFKLIK